VLTATNRGNLNELLTKLEERVKEIEPELELRKVSVQLDKEKQEILKNLLESGISEDMIADQLDLDVEIVKTLIHEFSKSP
jgi:DNA-binding NarL/FixJ family response regulator